MKSGNYNLKIKREDNSIDEVDFSFRFNFLSEDVANQIQLLLESNSYNCIKSKNKEKGFYIILIEEINNLFDASFILKIINQFDLEEKNYGFWISITSEYGHGGGYLPKEIRELFKKIGGQLDFSFMVGE